jgi:hypothetical protein
MPTESLLYKVKLDNRSSLYYAQYEWCITMNISEASCLRYLEPGRFEAAIRNAKHWANAKRTDWANAKWTDRAWSITKETALRETREVLLAETTPFKTVVSFMTVSVYTNHRGLADRLVTLGNDGVRVRLARQAVISRPANVVQLRESKYAYRTYFKERKYTREQRLMLANFLNSRRDTLRVSLALDNWVNGKFIGYIRNHSYSRAHYFVDHDHPNEGTMLSLVMPSIVRKTMPIQTTK